MEVIALRGRVAQLEKQQKEEAWEESPEVQNMRAKLVRALAAMLPKALTDAKRGKPALLRLITRTIRLR